MAGARTLSRRPNQDVNPIDDDPEVLDVVELPAVLGQIHRAEIDAQVATARKYPRSIKRFLEEAKQIATLDPEIAATCFYSLPRGGKYLTGPSVRLAEIVASCWTNLRTSSRIIEDTGSAIKAEAVCLDLERNNGFCITVTRRVTDRNGRRYSDDMINTTSNAAVSIALRNAIFKVVPPALVQPIYKAAMRTAAGDEKSFAENRKDCLAYFERQAVKPERVFKALGLAGVEDVSMEHLSILRGLAASIKDGEMTVDEAFPEWKPIDAVAGSRAKGTEGLRQRMAPEPEPEPVFREGVKEPLRTEAADDDDLPAGRMPGE